jgi:NTF2-like N-terminal transpeptidase domain
MKITLPLLLAIVTVVLITVGTLWPQSTSTVMYIAGEGTGALATTKTPEGAVQSVLDNVKKRQFHHAYSFVANTNQVDEKEFTDDMNGTWGSLRTYSNLEDADLRVLRKTENEAMVRTTIKWATAVGAFYDTRDLKVVHRDGQWKVVWPQVKVAQVPPQVIPVNYLRWDVIFRGAGDEWGAQNVEAPHVRLISMKATSHGNATVIVGEVLNEDTVPAFVSVNATLVGKDGRTIGQESSFDKMSHVLLPKEVSPFRIDFPNVKLADVKSVRMQPGSTLTPASADPVIGVVHQRLETDARGRRVLAGELLNESGQVVNIPHVLATYYNNTGQVIWVSDGYVDKALLPQTPIPFAVDIPDDVASQVQSYRVTVNHYSQSGL